MRSIDPAQKLNGIGLHISSNAGIVVPEVVVEQPDFLIEVLSSTFRVDAPVLPP